MWRVVAWRMAAESLTPSWQDAYWREYQLPAPCYDCLVYLSTFHNPFCSPRQ